LNKGADGKFIYLVYKLGTDANLAVADIFLTRPDAKSAATLITTHRGNTGTYIRRGQDLNEATSTKGDKIYLCFAGYNMLSTKAAGAKPIREIEVVAGGKSLYAQVEKDGWKGVRWQNSDDIGDCNKNAKGDYVYIRYR